MDTGYPSYLCFAVFFEHYDRAIPWLDNCHFLRNNFHHWIILLFHITECDSAVKQTTNHKPHSSRSCYCNLIPQSAVVQTIRRPEPRAQFVMTSSLSVHEMSLELYLLPVSAPLHHCNVYDGPAHTSSWSRPWYDAQTGTQQGYVLYSISLTIWMRQTWSKTINYGLLGLPYYFVKGCFRVKWHCCVVVAWYGSQAIVYRNCFANNWTATSASI